MGREVPAYQPEAAREFFRRVGFEWDTATREGSLWSVGRELRSELWWGERVMRKRASGNYENDL